MLVLIVCVAIGVVTRLTDTHPVVGQLQISQEWFNYRSSWTAFLPEVRAGQVWRLFTPALLHFGWPHLLFNLWTFWDLGRAIEWRRGSGTLLGLILGLGVISNLGQYLYTGPHFGGPTPRATYSAALATGFGNSMSVRIESTVLRRSAQGAQV